MTDAPFVINDSRLEFDQVSHRYILGTRELPSVTTILKLAGLVDYDAPWFTAEARERGSALHRAVLLDHENDLEEDSLDDELRARLEQFRRFKALKALRVLGAERLICDPVLGYAGTYDLLVEMDLAHGRGTTLLDIKSSDTPTAPIQTAGYTRCLRPSIPGVIFRGQLVVDGGAGMPKFTRHHDMNDESTFRGALIVAHWKLAKGVNVH